MTVQLYDLALADSDVRLSPYCWIVKFALLHKGVDFETIPLRFTEKHNYPGEDLKTLPILTDNDQTICDSVNIIAYLEKQYSGPALTNSSAELAAVEFYKAWMDTCLFPAIGPRLFVRVHAAAHEDDKEYFRKTREKRFGKTLEEVAMSPGLNEKTEAALQTLAAPLARYKFLGGDTPNLSDYNVFSVFMWQRVLTSETLYEMPQAVESWIERMLDLFDGYARGAKQGA